MPWWFWFLAVVIVLVLILNEVRKTSPWLAGLPGRAVSFASSFLSPLGGLGARLAGSGGLRLLAIPLAAGIVLGVVGFIKHQGRLEERVASMEVTQAALEHQAEVAAKANTAADRTHRNTAAAQAAARQGQEDIANAVASLPEVVTAEHFAELDRLYSDRYLGVLNNGVGESEPDPGARGASPVRRSGADAA